MNKSSGARLNVRILNLKGDVSHTVASGRRSSKPAANVHREVNNTNKPQKH